MLASGAQVIKIATSSQSVKDEVQWELPTFTEDEVVAIVSESHAAGVKVTSHAIGSQGTMTAVRAGVDGIEHGWGIADEVMEAMAERGTWLIPTFFIADYHRRFDPTAAEREQADRLLQGALDTVARARTMGVRIAMGSDAGEAMYGTAGGPPQADRVPHPGKAICSGGSTGRPKIIIDPLPWARTPGDLGVLGRQGLASGQTQLVTG
ncbi:amidohydrolase family protein [Microbispora sp. H11081]|uniref:amidohydrolase family protein n=1 Tax=Microbispora sp. H11081 TaxID=2729107 RepID=UPI0014757C57|nr:amidohydrolase family protein [Microbispora sp. H11081]